VWLILTKSPNGAFALYMLSALVLLPLLITVHEFGHAVVGHLVGLRLFWVTIGVGRRLFEFRLRGVRVSVHVLPLMGMTALAPRDGQQMRGRLFLAILAGPAMHLVLAVLATIFFLSRNPAETVLSFLSLASLAPAKVFVYANVLCLALSLIPRRSESAAGVMRTDGAILLRLGMHDETIMNEYRMASSILEAYEYQRVGRFSEAIQYYERALRQKPGNWMLQHDLAIAHLMSGDALAARSSLVALLDSEMGQSEHRLLLINNVAYADAVITNGSDDFLTEADTYSAEVLSKAPNVAAFRGARGVVLLQSGKVDEGLKHLKTAYRHHSEPNARATVACWIAMANARAGHAAEARKWVERARESCSGLDLLKKAEGELRAAA
jgi:tetratricopeptide (TPR) repeat protein